MASPPRLWLEIRYGWMISPRPKAEYGDWDDWPKARKPANSNTPNANLNLMLPVIKLIDAIQAQEDHIWECKDAVFYFRFKKNRRSSTHKNS